MVDTYDVLTTTEAKQILSISLTDTSKDSSVERVVTAVSRRLDRLIGPVVQRAVTDERAGARGCHLELAYGPVSAVSSVVEYQGTTAVTLTEETPGVEPTDGWVGERYAPNPSLLSGVLIRRCSGSDRLWWEGHGNVVVSYTAGRAAATASVDARHKEAAGLMVRNLWRSYENTVGGVDQFDTPTQAFPAFAVPNAVKELLADELQTDDGFGA